MIVIADTFPINYLVLIDLIQILPDLFGKVIIPQVVLRELQSTSAPDVVRQWLMNRPGVDHSAHRATARSHIG